MLDVEALLFMQLECIYCVELTVLRDAVSQVCTSSEPPVEGIFPSELSWVLTPFPKALLDESINWDQVCAHMHSIALTQEILTFMS